MCGIAGILGTHPEAPARLRAAVDAMSCELAHRGPDGAGDWHDPDAGIGLAHRRLAVLGPGAVGQQPMASVSGRYVVVHNGELYDHLNLRARLEREGRAPAWRGASDTETLLAGVEAWGLRATLERTTGMWAIGLWDRERQVLTLARDRMGEKPLSYVRIGRTFAFASQPSALEQIPGFDATVDRDALADLLRFGHVPRDRGIHVGVRKLTPGTLLEVHADGTVAEPTVLWSFLDAARAGVDDPVDVSEDEQVDLVGATLERAVLAQLLSDVPLGAFLSGGIDSSLVVATMQRISDRPVRTFTIGFESSRHDESAHAREVAQHLGTDHTEVLLTAQDALAIVPDLAAIYDEPFADASQIPTTLVSRVARRDVTVALSGDGGDELFGGYVRYLEAERFARLPRIAGLAYAGLYGLRGQERRRTLGLDVAAGEHAIVRRLLSSNARAERLVLRVDGRTRTDAFRNDWERTSGLGTVAARGMALDSIRYLPDDILHKVDRAAMSVALETRLPLLDHRLDELAWRLPMSARIRDGKGKWILRALLARDVPRHLFERPKRGFSVPIGTWLSGPLRGWAEELLAPAALGHDGLLDVAGVRRIWDDHLRGRWDAGAELWPIVMFQAWSEARRTTGATRGRTPSSP